MHVIQTPTGQLKYTQTLQDIFVCCQLESCKITFKPRICLSDLVILHPEVFRALTHIKCCYLCHKSPQQRMWVRPCQKSAIDNISWLKKRSRCPFLSHVDSQNFYVSICHLFPSTTKSTNRNLDKTKLFINGIKKEDLN